MADPAFGNRTLHWADYLIFALTLLGSVAIGIYYAVRERHKTTEDYLLAKRKMSVFPTAMSLMISYLSAITLLGDAAENYFFGITYSLYMVAHPFAALIVAYVFVPLFYPLKITSIQDYLMLRYNGDRITVYTAYFFQMLINVVTCGVYLYGPAVMLYSVSGLPMWASVILLGVASTIYSTVGGLKGVIWTDVFQTLVIVIAMLTVAIKGTIEAGGMGQVWQTFYDRGRLDVKIDMNPMNRMDLGTMVVVHILHRVTWYGVQQTSVQRFCSLSSLKAAKTSVLLVIPLLLIIAVLTGFSGVVAFSYFDKIGCDPYRGGFIRGINEILPFFVMTVLGVPGIPGLFVACIFCGSLSSLSSSFSSVSAMTWEDTLKHRQFFARLTDARKTFVTKLIVVIYGIVVTCFGLILTKMTGSIIKITFTVLSPLFSSTFLIIFLGASFPRINGKSATVGSVIGFLAVLWVAIGGKTIPPQHLPLPTTTANCSMYQTNTFAGNWTIEETTTVISPYLEPVNQADAILNTSTAAPAAMSQLQGIEKLYAMSSMWYSLFGIIVGIAFSLLLSIIPGFNTRNEDVKSEWLFPCVKYLTSRNIEDKEEEDEYKYHQVATKEHRSEDLKEKADVVYKFDNMHSYNNIQ